VTLSHGDGSQAGWHGGIVADPRASRNTCTADLDEVGQTGLSRRSSTWTAPFGAAPVERPTQTPMADRLVARREPNLGGARDPAGSTALGLYTARSSDVGHLVQMTPTLNRPNDKAIAYSLDGSRILFFRPAINVPGNQGPSWTSSSSRSTAWDSCDWTRLARYSVRSTPASRHTIKCRCSIEGGVMAPGRVRRSPLPQLLPLLGRLGVATWIVRCSSWTPTGTAP